MMGGATTRGGMTVTTPPTPAASRLRALRTIAIAYLGAIPLIGVAMTFVVPSGDPWGVPDLLGLVIPIVVGAACWAAILTIGLRVPALPAGTPTDPGVGIASYQTSMFVRIAFATLPAILSVALLFALPHATLVTYAIGAVISLVLIAVYVYPHRYNAALVERRLDRAGGRSLLTTHLGLDGPQPPQDDTGSARFH